MLRSKAKRQENDALGRILSYLVALATIVGIPAGLYGYFAGQHVKRVEKTFDFYKSFRSDPVQKQFGLLVARWNAASDKLKTLTDQNNDEEIRELATSLVADQEGGTAFEEVLSFFDDLSACVEASLCDRNAAVAVLQKPASQVGSMFGSHILYVRDKYGNEEYGTGVFRIRALKKEITLY